MPTVEAAPRPGPLTLQPGATLRPAPALLRRMLGCAPAVADELLDDSFLADGRTSLRCYLQGDAAAPLRAYISSDVSCDDRELEGALRARMRLCPLLRGGLLLMYSGTELG